jgi:hypothetical protein
MTAFNRALGLAQGTQQTAQHTKLMMLVDKAVENNIHGNTRKSIDWYRKEIKNLVTSGLGTINQKTASNFGTFITIPEIGSMMTFVYDPKTAEDLDYYDIAPLILCFNITKTGFYGINLHYLHPEVRAMIISKLLQGQSGRLDRQSKIKLSWQILQAAIKDKYISHSVKQYLFTHVRSKVSKIDGEYWKMTINLPYEKFRGATKKQVWRESERKK